MTKGRAGATALATMPDDEPAAGECILRIDLDDKDRARTVAGFLHELADPLPTAVTLFEEGDRWRVEAYYGSPSDADAMAADLAGAMGDAAGIDPLSVTVVPVPRANWVAISQAALPPVRIGRFVVHGSHDRARVGRGPHAIEIEAGEAFGTAHHATTQGCLSAIDRLARSTRVRTMLDLGCGSGVLAIAAARTLPRIRIVASDIDARSVEVARENVHLNGAAARISVVHAAGLAHPRLRRARFNVVVANILAGPLIALRRDITNAVAPRGTLVLSGLLTVQSREVIAHYRASGFALVRHDISAGWSTLTLRPSQHPKPPAPVAEQDD